MSPEDVTKHLESDGSIAWTTLAELMGAGCHSCVDGRDAGAVLGTPGGDAGEYLVHLACIERVTGAELGGAELQQMFDRFLLHFGRFYMHTDRHAVDNLAATLAGDDAFAEAKARNVPVLLSVGYAACHWCHVMEHESFEDTAVANLMNKHFICIKVDREERPDVDHVYMDAVQAMTGQGGWPLNCFATPDGRPFYGGTYFPKDQWMQIIHQLGELYQNDRQKIEEYANKLMDGLNQMDDLPIQPMASAFNSEVTQTAVIRWAKEFDWKEGGPNKAPKFPLPSNYEFLLAHGTLQNDTQATKFTELTLRKMARGGIYDQLGGGFARYSVDAIWKVPHFEKMLYDNGQLLSLYSQAYKASNDSEFLDVIEETSSFIQRELTDISGAFYSALDADSEGEEGKFYVWTEEEIKTLAGKDFETIKTYYNISKKAHWEHGNNILLRDASDAEIANELEISMEELHGRLDRFHEKAILERDQRIRPGLDDKCLTSWNAMTSKGLIEAYLATGNKKHLELARQNLTFLLNKQLQENGSLWHSYKNGKSTITAYLEDYAHLIDALIKMYEATFEEEWLLQAKSTYEFVVAHFEQNQNGFFYFKAKDDAQLVSKKVEILDNVIPASNSVFATCGYKLGLLFGKPDWINQSKKALTHMEPSFTKYPSGHSQWMLLHQHLSEPFYEVAIVGSDWENIHQELTKEYLPNVIFCGGETEGSLDVLQGKLQTGKTMIYVCQEGACKQPTESISEALNQLL